MLILAESNLYRRNHFCIDCVFTMAHMIKKARSSILFHLYITKRVFVNLE